MITLPLAPLWLLEIFCSFIVIILCLLSLRISNRLVKRDPENALWLFLNWLCITFVIFSVLHVVAHFLLEVVAYWNLPDMADWQRAFGGFDSIIYVTIAAITLFFHRIQRLYQRMQTDHHHLEETSHEILALNREMEALVMERTMSEMALGMAHGIRNPLHVIGGFSHRLLKKTDESDPSRAWATAIAEEAKRIEHMVERFETLALRKTSFFAQEDLNAIIQDTLELLRPELRAKNLNLVSEYLPRTPDGPLQQTSAQGGPGPPAAQRRGSHPPRRHHHGAHFHGEEFCGFDDPGHRAGHAPGRGGQGLRALLHHQIGRHRSGHGLRAPDRG